MVGQKGIAQILVVLILLGGLLTGVYLVGETQIFKPRATSVLISAPIGPTCRSRISNFSVDEPCDAVQNGFLEAKFTCQAQIEFPDLNTQGGGPGRECRTIEDWVRIADQACNEICQLPVPSLEPFPPVCPAEFPRCDGELLEVPDPSGCPRYICVNISPFQIPQPIPVPTTPPSCPPWAPYCPTANTCLFITKECLSPEPSPVQVQ